MTPPRRVGKRKRRAELSRGPQHLRDGHWYYEERRGIFVIRCGECADVVCGPFIYLPWKQLDASVRRWRATRRKHAK